MEALKPYTLKFSPTEIERADRLVKRIPEFEGKRSPLVRLALREYIDRKERELEGRESQEPVAA